ncbi:MAG: hypothetical protein M3245_00550, partial [Actinomycetota bacterium]|nr:hypothetical protein [Actinomycetota bacterium]
MKRSLLALGLVVAMSFTAASLPAPRAPVAQAGPVVVVDTDGVRMRIPSDWDVRSLRVPGASAIGIQASRGRWRSPDAIEGIEAYWVDATKVRVPSDYYYLLARARAAEHFSIPRSRCTQKGRRILANNRPLFGRHVESPGDYVVTATGTCRRGDRVTRWVSFEAAPGFGPVRDLGIPRSGYYSVLVMVPEGPNADRRARRLMRGVSFGGTSVRTMMRAASRR